MLGENAWWTFWRVTFPGVMPGIVASMLLTFVISFDEFVMAFFLSGNEVTLPILIWSQLRFSQQFPSILALATLILFFSIPLILLAMWINRLGLAPGQIEGDGA
jgi:spermidine/putrescine transport system permease protein